MLSTLFTYITQHTQTTLTEEEQGLIQRAFQPKKLRKKQYLLQEGDICRYLGFVVRGAMRQYSIDDKGTEHIVHLAVENWWVGDRESYLMLMPSYARIKVKPSVSGLFPIKTSQKQRALNKIFKKLPAFSYSTP